MNHQLTLKEKQESSCNWITLQVCVTHLYFADPHIFAWMSYNDGHDVWLLRVFINEARVSSLKTLMHAVHDRLSFLLIRLIFPYFFLLSFHSCSFISLILSLDLCSCCTFMLRLMNDLILLRDREGKLLLLRLKILHWFSFISCLCIR